ncbi:MAG: TerC family protein [Acidobacteria bacterium]|nr:TerC family protein [Acidobacteriota bacterium]
MTTTIEPVYWIAFLAFIGFLLFLDLFVFHRNAHVVKVREAAIFSAFWISLGVAFGVLVFFWLGPDKGVEYFTGYLIEKSLSVDNVFVFALIFGAFAVPAQYQHRVLFWGVVGALAMRLVMIVAGAALIEAYQWILYVFGAFLILTGIRMGLSHGKPEKDPSQNPVVRFARRRLPFSDAYDGQRFFTRVNAKRVATPLLLVLISVEITDLIFAVDSIPAIFAVTRDPFIVYTSNAFAILGLRALYFLLADLKNRFRYLKLGLAVILVFVGVKLTVVNLGIKIDPIVSLIVVGTILGTAIVASWLRPETPEVEGHPDLPWPTDELGDGPAGGGATGAGAAAPDVAARPG